VASPSHLESDKNAGPRLLTLSREDCSSPGHCLYYKYPKFQGNRRYGSGGPQGQWCETGPGLRDLSQSHIFWMSGSTQEKKHLSPAYSGWHLQPHPCPSATICPTSQLTPDLRCLHHHAGQESPWSPYEMVSFKKKQNVVGLRMCLKW
jgi:hypothetical protein